MIHHIELSENILQYIRDHSLRDHDLLRELRDETARLSQHSMQIPPEQGQFLYFLARLIGARNALEVGVFTGYSALCTALALPDDGRLTACDVSAEWMEIARRYWKRAGVGGRIEARVGDARATLTELLAQGRSETYDFAFIDADKENYESYYESALTLVRPGGLIVLDNTLWSGLVANPAVSDPETDALRHINRKALRDERVDISMLPFADGLTLVRKRSDDEIGMASKPARAAILGLAVR